jgi:hypothetical protein
MAKRVDPRLAGILRTLRAQASPLRQSGVTLVVDFVLARPLRDFVDREGLVQLLVDSLRSEGVVQMLRDRVPGAWSRHVRRSRDERLPLGAAFAEEVRARLREVITSTPPPPARWTRAAVDPVLVRKLIAPALQDVLLAFARRLPLPGFGTGETSWPGMGAVVALGNRVREEVERRAGQVAEAGRAVLSGIGLDVEGQIEAVTREFSQTAERGFREALTKRIGTPEGRTLLGEIQGQILDRLLAARFDELHEDVESVPWRELAEIAAPALDHLRRQPFLSRALREEVGAWLDADGARPVRALLDEVGLLAPVRRHALARADELARKLFSSAAFSRWLGELLGSVD